jgi:FlaA1/EpsC-like NDP-sugar epimerase
VNLLVLPSASQLVTQGVGLGDLRAIGESDLLGRAAVETDQQAISELIHGKRVLVTGAGGSVGSERARKIYPFGPSRLFLLERRVPVTRRADEIHRRVLPMLLVSAELRTHSGPLRIAI